MWKPDIAFLRRIEKISIFKSDPKILQFPDSDKKEEG
jgi:hypothetical protein